MQTTATSRQGRNRSGTVLGTLAVLIALWLGLTAPSVSPVSPGAGAGAAVPAAAVADQAVVGDQAPPPGAGPDGRGRGR